MSTIRYWLLLHIIKAILKPLLFISNHFSTLTLVTLVLSGTFCFYAVSHYLHLHCRIDSYITPALLILGVYSLNRYSDSNEDFYSRRKAFSFLNKSLYLGISITALSIFLLYFIIIGSLNAYLFAFLFLSVSYSIPTIPWIKKGELLFIRLKQIPIVKNIIVALLTGTSPYVLFFFCCRKSIVLNELSCLLCIALIVYSYTNTTFNDIKDVIGDRLSKTITVPILLSAEGTVFLLTIVNLVWLYTAYAILYAIGIYPVTIFFLIMFLYAMVFVYGHHFKLFSDRTAELLSEIGFTVYGTMLMLCY